jgi:hypothetical protein
MQSPTWDDKKKKAARYGDVITMPILVSHSLTHHVSVLFLLLFVLSELHSNALCSFFLLVSV